jgi:hypothetical protein
VCNVCCGVLLETVPNKRHLASERLTLPNIGVGEDRDQGNTLGFWESLHKVHLDAFAQGQLLGARSESSSGESSSIGWNCKRPVFNSSLPNGEMQNCAKTMAIYIRY